MWCKVAPSHMQTHISFPSSKAARQSCDGTPVCVREALQTCACMVYDTPTGCCSRRGVNWSFDLSFFECVESFLSLVERESAASRRQNSEGGTLTCSLWGRTTTNDQRSNVVKFCGYEMFSVLTSPILMSLLALVRVAGDNASILRVPCSNSLGLFYSRLVCLFQRFCGYRERAGVRLTIKQVWNWH